MPVQNAEVAAMFDQAAELLEIQGENPFRVRAYRRAARVVEALPQSVRGMLSTGADLSELPGIGRDLAEKITGIVNTWYLAGSIEALTATAARHNANNLARIAKTAAAELRTTVDELPARIGTLIEERKRLERDLSEAKKKLAMGGGHGEAGASADGVRKVGDVKLMARAVEGIELKDLRSLADDGKKKLGSGVVAIVGVSADGKAGIVVGVTNDLVTRFNAIDLARKGAEVLGGKGGGGRPDMAQAGGPDGSKAQAAIAAIEAALAG